MARELDSRFDILEGIMMTQRAVREFTDDPVDDEVIERAIRAASHAPSGGNSQPWRFVVVRDVETKTKLGAIFDELAHTLFSGRAPERTPWQDVPALIAICSEGGGGRGKDAASIFPVVQNLLLALHGLGLGSVLTRRWQARPNEVKALLGLPENMETHAILPVGWPIRKYGKGKRLPVSEVTSRERFGNAWS